MERRIEHEINVFRKTEVVSDWLAKKIAKYDWVRYEAFPALRPPDLTYDYVVNHYLTSNSQWWVNP
jgi:hypothetical protein